MCFLRRRRRVREREENAEKERQQREEATRQLLAAKEILRVSIAVLRINDLGDVTEGEVRELTPAILNQMKKIKEDFLEHFPALAITKIEYIMNETLYTTFDETRKEFRRLSRNAEEIVLFHGTLCHNIDRYIPS